MVCKTLLHHANHVLRHLIGCKSSGRRQHTWTFFAKAAAVFGVKVPFIPNGFLSIHQDARFDSKLSVKKLQAQLLSAGRML